ncbi:MAG: hypothetical protein ACP5I4_07335 [Oceanipulchritudo sp.]
MEPRSAPAGNRIETKLAVEAIDLQKKLEPHGRSLTEAVDFYLEHLKQAATSGPVKDCVTEFLEAKRNDNLSKRHLSDLGSS